MLSASSFLIFKNSQSEERRVSIEFTKFTQKVEILCKSENTKSSEKTQCDFSPLELLPRRPLPPRPSSGVRRTTWRQWPRSNLQGKTNPRR